MPETQAAGPYIFSRRTLFNNNVAKDMQIRPTKLPFPDLWSLDGAVSFVANAIEYEPVENPLHPPEHLLSPQSVLAFQAGDSFDLACLLVSILTGCGFDAYVTVGYAPSDVVQNDQTKQVLSPVKTQCATSLILHPVENTCSRARGSCKTPSVVHVAMSNMIPLSHSLIWHPCNS